MTGLLAIVPARAGSKGLPGKNKAMIAGLPLVEYTIAALEGARSVEGIALTTDDSDILARYCDRKSVFLIERPAALSQDDTPSAAVVSHALDAWEGAGRISPTALLVAQPTSPLRVASDIDKAFTLFERTGRAPLVSACKVEGSRHPANMYRLRSDGLYGDHYVEDGFRQVPRQTREILYQRNGAIYLVTTEYFRSTGRLRGAEPVIYEMPWERSIDIDSPGDLLVAKALLESGLVNPD
jgi:CMP-N-acetylneuraminic acid synthetase